MRYRGKLYALRIDRQVQCVCLVRGKVGSVSYGNNPKLPALVGEVVWDFTKLQIFRSYRTSASVEFYEADWHYNTVTEL